MMQQETYDSGPNQALTRYEPSAGGVPTRQDMHAVTAAWDALMAGEEGISRTISGGRVTTEC